MTEKKTIQDFALNEAIMDHNPGFWDEPNADQKYSTQELRRKDEFFKLEENEELMLLSHTMVCWWLTQLFDPDMIEAQKVVDLIHTEIKGDEMWALKIKQNNQNAI